ncbi:uroporphyrinogen decarboxylase family protein, partial [Streptomyces sp. NPDC059873]
LQGNLDPAVLFAPTAAVETKTREVLDAAAGLEGHVFNLGHGVLPSMDPDALTRLVEYVHTQTAR